jgi:protein translocase SecG subunit
MDNLLAIAQIAVSVIMTALILFQQRGTALGSAFGGQESGFYTTQRGIQKRIYWATIVCGLLFIALSVANLIGQ